MATEVQTAAVVVEPTRDSRARLRPLPINAVRISDPIWEPRRQRTLTHTLREQHALLENTGRLANFRRTAGLESGPFEGLYFNDTDVYKWLEAASWSLATDPDPELDALVDDVIATVASAQQPDGYLDNFYTLADMSKQWTELTRTHELYCAGHLFQAAVAHHRATGKTNLLDIACRFADLLVETFGPAESGKRPGTDGHEEVELALVELGRVTGDRRYIDQAAYFLDARGYGLVGGDEYHQDHKPFREMDTIVGHAVRAVYYAAGAADIYTETGDETILAALHRLWDNMVQRRIYVTSGIGARWEGEAFGRDFELPNTRAYTESCAAIGSIMWNWRMLLLDGDAKYADLIESTLYNALLPGLSLSGNEYFYQNPLADDRTHRREPWFDCACCPPNIARTLTSISGYIATTSDDGAWLHLYAASDAELTLADGRQLRLRQRTAYPWDERITIEVDGSGSFSLFLRIPAWCSDGALTVNGDAVSVPLTPGTYARVDRDWTPGDTVELTLPMPVRRVAAHPYLFENTNRVAVFRGPILYCAEQADNPGVDPRDILLPADPTFTFEHRPDLLGGVTILKTKAALMRPADSWSTELYRPVTSGRDLTDSGSTRVTLIPYHLWANRDPGRMEVWLRSPQ